MAGKKSWLQFRTMGAVALDAYRANTAESLPQSPPKKRPQRSAPEAPAKTSPILLALGIAVCGFLLILAMFGGSELARTQKNIAQMEKVVSDLEAEREAAQEAYDWAVDLDKIGQKARALGMVAPGMGSVRVIAVSPETPETETQETPNSFSAVWFAIRDTARELFAYLGGT